MARGRAAVRTSDCLLPDLLVSMNAIVDFLKAPVQQMIFESFLVGYLCPRYAERRTAVLELGTGPTCAEAFVDGVVAFNRIRVRIIIFPHTNPIKLHSVCEKFMRRIVTHLPHVKWIEIFEIS